jgi:DNA-binding response OmpR family regulator
MRILVIEDEIKLANAIKRALEIKKYAVDVCTDGISGFDMAVGEDFDLILLDVMLPGMDGMTVCKKMREEGKTTPILMLTAKGQINDKVTGLDIGADDYMVKPFSFEELFARIRALIRRPKHVTQTVLKIKDITLNSTSYTVKRNTTPIQLSTKEFAILEYLMRFKNTVVSRDQLVNHVWNYDADVLPNVVEVHIKHLRDKIDAPFLEKVIQTIRGRGYMIVDN